MGAVLEARSLSKHFGTFAALHDVSFTLNAGEIVGFLGPNGAGKSTTMKILTGFLAPGGGSATVCGHDLVADPLACRRAIGYLPEELPLYLDMRVDAYLDHVARLKGIPAAERRRAVLESIEAAWLKEQATRHIRKLSKGNRQRVGLAQALLARPPLISRDEPTNGLDPTQVANFRDLLRSLAGRHTILLSTHILGEVEAVCSRVVVVHRGRTIADEPVEALRARAARAGRVRVRLRAGSPELFADRLAAEGWAAVLDGDSVVVEAAIERRADLIAAAESAGGLRELVEERRSLEDVFRDLTSAATPVGPGPIAAESATPGQPVA